MRRGLAPLISAVLLIAIAFGIAALVSPWAFNLATDVSNQTTSDTMKQITCQNAKYDFDTSYATNGINFSLSTTNDIVNAKIVNTGTINLHSFSIEIETTNASTLTITQLELNSTSQKTKALPLKPGQSALLKANVSTDLTGTLTKVKVLNGVCPSTFIDQDI